MNPKMKPERWKLVDELMDAAFDLQPDQIPQFLQDVCNGDETLRQELERLLAADQRANKFIESPVLDETNTSDPETLISALRGKIDLWMPFKAGEILNNRYELVKKLGKGGMGEVWHAFDVRLGVDVALKSLRSGVRKNSDHLRSEVRAAREVISPNVCRIFDLVVLDLDRELISMEYIDGLTLFDLLSQSGPLELKRAMDIALQFLSGLEAIHQAGLVHRDLKPENIMITRTGRVVVMDFGLSRKSEDSPVSRAGTLPYMSPEQLSTIFLDGRSDIFAAGIILAEMIHSRGVLSEKTREAVWHAIHTDPKRIPESPWKQVITRAVAANREDRFQTVGELIRALEDVTQRTEGSEENRPYPGLASFGTFDGEYFFGREQEVETMLRKIEQSYMLAVVGPSGAGKTSFVRAGLLKTLPENWFCIFTFPGDSPFSNLAQSLPQTIGGPVQFSDTAEVINRFRNLRSSCKEIVLIIDRFEELFTLNPPTTQSQYAELIGRLSMEVNVRVVLVVRDDFLILCKNFDSLNPIFSEITPILPLTGAALRRAFVEPALKSGYRFEDESMVDLVLSDVENERGALPLLAFAASRLWEKRDRKNGILTRQAYREIGGVSGGLAHYAEKILEQMSESQQSTVRELFRNLVTAQNTRVARNAVDLLSVFPDRTAAEEVLRILIDARLLTSFESPSADGGNKRRIEIIHESLLSAWPRLIRWQTQDEESAEMRDQLRQAAELWQQRGRSEDLLWTGDAYFDFQKWRQSYAGKLTALEEAFAQAMVHYAERARKKRQLLVALTFAVIIVVLTTITFFWRSASRARDAAVLETRRAEAGRVLAIARSQSLDPTTKLAYALRSLEFADNPEARKFAIEALSEGPVYQLLNHAGMGIQFSPDGKWIAAGQHGGGMLLIPQNGGSPITVTESDSPPVLHIAWYSQFSPDSEYLLWTWRKNTSIVKMWSVSKKTLVRNFQFEGTTMCFVRNEKAFFISDISGRTGSPFYWNKCIVRVWDFRSKDPEILGRVHLQSGGWKSFDIDEHGRWIAYTKGNDVFAEELQALGKVPSILIGTHKANTRLVRFNPNGKEIGVSDDIGEIRLWSLDFKSARKKPLRIIPGTGQVLFDFRFDPDGNSIMARGLWWDLMAPQDAIPSSTSLGGLDTIDKKHRWFATGGNSIGVFNYEPLRFYEFHGLVPAQSTSNVRFTPDGKSWISGFLEDGISIHKMPGEERFPAERERLWNHKLWTNQSLSLDVDPTGKYVAALTEGDGVHLISLQGTGDTKLKGASGNLTYQLIAFSPDGKSVAAEGDGIEIWDLASGTSHILHNSKSPGISKMLFSKDGALLSGDAKGNIRRWNLVAGTYSTIGTSSNRAEVTGMAVSNDNRSLAIITWSGNTSELTIYDLQKGATSKISSHGTRVNEVAFDPSGKLLITGDADGVIRVGSISGGVPILLFGHKSGIGDLQVHPNGKWILSAEGGNPVVRLWRIPEGEPLQSLPADKFRNAIRALTNVRVVPDANLPAGHRIDLAPFQGWRVKTRGDHVLSNKN